MVSFLIEGKLNIGEISDNEVLREKQPCWWVQLPGETGTAGSKIHIWGPHNSPL